MKTEPRWSEFPAETRLSGLFYSRTSDVYGMHDATPAGGRERLRVRECSVFAEGDPESRWVIQRIGPLVSTGGDMTSFVSWNDPGHVAAEIPKGGVLHLSGYVARPIQPDGTPIPYPPIHQHHAHLNPDLNPYAFFTGFSAYNVLRSFLAAVTFDPWRPWKAFDAVSQIMHAIAEGRIDQMHGDMQCPDDDGGMDCMVHRTSAASGEYSVPISRLFYTDTMLQDVRRANSPEFVFWYESAIRVGHKGGEHRLSNLMRKTVAGVSATRDTWFGPVPGVLADPYVTYRVPMTGNSYIAGAQRVEPGKEWLVLTGHMHRRAAAEHWVVLGEGANLEALGLSKSSASSCASLKGRIYESRCSDWMTGAVQLDGPGQPTSDSIKQTFLKNVQKLRSQGNHIVLCVARGPHDVWLKPTNEQQAFGVHEGSYDRYSGFYCDSPRLFTSRVANETTDSSVAAPTKLQSFATEICFHRTPVDYHEPWFPMHGTLFIQERADSHVSDEKVIRDNALSPVLATAARLTYDDVTVRAWEAAASILALLATAISLCCAACPCICPCGKRLKCLPCKRYQTVPCDEIKRIRDSSKGFVKIGKSLRAV